MRKLLIGSLLAVLLSACSQTTVVLLPDDDNNVGKVSVTAGGSEQLLQNANEYATATKTVGKPGIMSQADIDRNFAHSLAALPQAPVSYLVYFPFGSADPDAASVARFGEVVKAIKARKVPNVTVIGHADRIGEREYNLRLSMQRAMAVERILVSRGVDPAVLTVSGHGENDPLVETGPGVPEPKNRRVEIFIR